MQPIAFCLSCAGHSLFGRPLTRRPPLISLLFATFASAVSGQVRAAPTSDAIDVFKAGTEGFHTFRIPVLLASPRDTLLAFCEGRRDDISDHATIFLLLKRSFDGGRTWQPAQVVWREEGRTTGNPAPVLDDATGRILLLFCRNNNSVYLTSSDDDGATWKQPRNLTREVRQPGWEWYATGPSPGVCLRDGRRSRLVIPCNHSVRLGDTVTGRAHAIYSDDHGETWQLGEPVPLPETARVIAAELARVELRHRREALVTPAADPPEPNQTPRTAGRDPKSLYGGNESAIVELPGGVLLMNTRGSPRGTVPRRAMSISRDGGETWTPLRHLPDLVEPSCHADLRSVPAGIAGAAGPVLIFSNPAHPPIPDSDKGRRRMTVRLSFDGGERWTAGKLLLNGPASYSSLTVLADGTVLCLFEGGQEHRREWIRLVRFPFGALLPGK